MRQDHYQAVADGFDRAADSYDTDYGANPIMAWLEDDTFARLAALFPPGSRLFEVGCGTGQMAVRLAQSGRVIVASDISPAMIERARLVATPSATDSVTWVTAPAAALADALPGETGRFDGGYSNFGPLNCDPELDKVAKGLATLVRPGGAFLCSVMGRFSAWELAWGILTLRPREATRRLGRGWVAAHMSGAPGEAPAVIPVRYYTPRGFARSFAPYFRVETALAYPLLIPPPHMATRFPSAPARLQRLERAFAGLPGLRALGDHFLLVLRRTDTEPADV
jgi:ubiquinone/menaquinone biosynthesis C-methylase UbiE